jgi:F0F1-type ATP synthase assembly protein I
MIYFVAGLAAVVALGAGLGWITVTVALTVIGLLLSGGVAGVHYMLKKTSSSASCCK